MPTNQANPADVQEVAIGDIECTAAAVSKAPRGRAPEEGAPQAGSTKRKAGSKAANKNEPGSEAAKKPANKSKRGRPRVAPYREGAVWSYRVRRAGVDIYETGFENSEAAHEAMNALIIQLGTGKAPMYGGPKENSVGKSMQRYGLDHLPGLKGAPQAVRRMNRWLNALRLPLLAILPLEQADQAPKNVPVRKGRYWAVYLVRHADEPRIQGPRRLSRGAGVQIG